MAKFLFFDFRCQSEVCKHKFTDMVKPDVFQAACPECGGESKRLISAPRLDPRLGLDPESFPTMGDKWAKKHRQRRRIEDERAAKHGES